MIKITISNSSIFRGRCLHCGDFPQMFFDIINSLYKVSPQKMSRVYVHKLFGMVDKFIVWEVTTKIPNLSFKVNHHKIHKKNPRFVTTDYISCGCGKTKWALNDIYPKFTSKNKCGKYGVSTKIVNHYECK